VNGFLRRMEASSRARASAAAAREPLLALRRRALDTTVPPPLRNGHAFELIAEYKRRSPALGRLAGEDDARLRRVEAYARGGAAAISVLTEPTEFDGRLEHLTECAAALAPHAVPVMRKDFLVDPYQVYEARVAGAGGVLLIVRMLDDASLSELTDCARELSLFVLLECFDAADIARAAPYACVESVLVGVNCRDLESLAVERSRLAGLAPLLPAGSARVAESGFETPEDCASAARAGYRMALVGGALMTAPDPADAVRRMLAAGRAAA
jgi:indole-3-glycerol phosphate synthase